MADISKMFDAYNKHLNVIRELGITDRIDDYICPLCLHGFSREDINELSLEDAPQDKLGGSKIAITCKHCNNTCGNTIDNHLINYVDLTERKCFLPGSDRKVRITNLGEGKPIKAILRVNNQDEMDLVIHKDYYNSESYKERLDSIVKDTITMVQDKPIKLNTKYVYAAIIKNAYIILFSLTGYTFLLDNYYNRIRNHINNPDSYDLPKGMWKRINYLPIEDGVYISYNKQYLGFFIIYTISRILSYRYLVYLPSPSINFDKAIEKFQKLKSGDSALLKRIDGFGFLFEIEKIELLREWVYS